MTQTTGTNRPLHPNVAHLLSLLSRNGGRLVGEVASMGLVDDLHAVGEKVAHHAPPSPEVSVALRKLLEAQDAVMRAFGQ